MINYDYKDNLKEVIKRITFPFEIVGIQIAAGATAACCAIVTALLHYLLSLYTKQK